MDTRNAGNKARRSPFGELLVTFRNQRGFTQEKLARATHGESISSRSITNYERAVIHPRDWILPHRPGLRLLVDALNLDMVDHHSLVTAWDKTRSMRTAAENQSSADSFHESGREDAIQSILDVWGKVQSGEPHIVMIDGVTGIGKTALARHISDRIASSTRKVMIAWGSAGRWATDVEPYYVVRQATDHILEPPDKWSALPGNYSSRPVPGEDEISRIVESIPLLAGALISERSIHKLSLPIDDTLNAKISTQLSAKTSTGTVERMEEYFNLLIDLAKSWPIVLVLEDLHWSGDQTFTLLSHITHRLRDIRNAPILIIGTYRNDEVPGSGDHPLDHLRDSLNNAPFSIHINLNNTLAPPASMAYVRAIVTSTPMRDAENAEQLTTWLHTQTSGHPLLVGELVHHLIESDALFKHNETQWRFDAAQIPEETPSAISAFMAQRLGRVSKQARRILDIAAVMNDVIITEIIAEIMHIDEAEILEVIDQELDAIHQLLLPGPSLQLRQRSHISYRFHRAIFREHVYQNISSPRRRNLHLAIAHAMEDRYTDADTDALSEITDHYVQAEEWHSAQMAGYRQAQQAALKLDWDLAELWFRRAEELALKAQDPVQLWRTRAAHLAVYRGTGRYKDGIKSGERIIEISERHNWITTTALAYHHLGEIYYDLGRIDKTIAHLRTAVSLHEQENSLDLAAAGYSMLSHATHRRGKFDTAHRYAQQALKLSRELGNTWVQPEAVLATANCEVDLGYYEDAIENYKMATELAMMAGRLHNQFIPPMNIGLCHVFMENHEEAVKVLEELIQTIRAQSVYRHIAPPSLYLGYAQEALGRLDAAAAAYATSAEIRRTSIPQPTLYDAVAGQMRVAILQRDYAAAKEWRDEITVQMDQHGWEGMEYPLLVMTSLARAYRHFGDEDAFRDYVVRAHHLLMERAEMIENQDSRHSYLTNVPMNVEVQVLFDSLKETKS